MKGGGREKERRVGEGEQGRREEGVERGERERKRDLVPASRAFQALLDTLISYLSSSFSTTQRLQIQHVC